MRRAGRIVLVLVVILIVALAGCALWVRGRMAASLAQQSGERALPGLTAAVTVERDALGVPTIRGANRLDVARATGFVHAQERFFQMDLLRRRGAGELAELLGPALVEVDRADRLHRFRALAETIVAGATPADRALLDAYTQGVNSGLEALGAPPFEYLLLRSRPRPWQPEDSVLAVTAMFFELQDSQGAHESGLGVMHDTLPPALFDFLAPRGSEWDAPLEGGPLAAVPIPGPEALDLRRQPPAAPARAAALRRPFAPRPEDRDEDLAAGSNNWAVDGAHTADGHALLANDMHLGLRVPGTWFRASFVWPAEDGAGERRLTGVTLPGTPLLVVGSNGHVAWGFTNTEGDWSDLVVLEVDPRRTDLYRTPDGLRPFVHHAETIRVRGGRAQTLDVVETIWGPVVDKDHSGRPRAFSWTAHHQEAVNLASRGLEAARTVDEAIAVAHQSGIPAQNLMLADDTGRIGWTVIGRIPRRVGFDGRLPVSWADGSRRWDGWVPADEVPKVVDPPAGRLWTANSRVTGGADLALLGDIGYDLGARATQIRDDLLRLDKAAPKDLLAIQLDDRALFLNRWRGLLLQTLTPAAVAGHGHGHPDRAELRRLVETTWTGRASIGSAAYRIVRAFRLAAREVVFTPLVAACAAADERFDYDLVPHSEAPLWALVKERPPHLLDPRFKSWDEALLAAVDATIGNLHKAGGGLASLTWGRRNTTAIRHPMSAALPFAARLLDVPPHQLPGDSNMPRVQGPAFGASERIVVAPGHEETGIFELPVGESGNPLSPHYRDSEPAWENGEPRPFLPGAPVARLTLVPAPAAPK
ncbi:MAG TPA: penicillin acylase family protein [Thermoanaerobaculia bacterium]